MSRPETLEQLEATAGRALQRALPRAEVPADAAGRIGARLNAAIHAGGSANVVPFPRKGARRPVQWVVGVAVAALVIMAGGLGFDRLRQGGAPDGNGPLTFAAVAEAADKLMPTSLPNEIRDAVTFRLETTLPELPEQAPASTLVMDRYSYHDPALEPPVGAAKGAPVDPAVVEQTAIAWLKERGYYPTGPLTVSAKVDRELPQVAYVHIFTGPGAEFESSNEFPQIYVALNEGKIFTVMGWWPKGTAATIKVPLKTIEQAWAEVQAGKGILLGIAVTEEPVEWPQDKVVTVRKIELDRAIVHSGDGHSFMIPAVVFHGEVVDVHGEVRPVSAIVSAVRSE